MTTKKHFTILLNDDQLEKLNSLDGKSRAEKIRNVFSLIKNYIGPKKAIYDRKNFKEVDAYIEIETFEAAKETAKENDFQLCELFKEFLK